MIAFGPVPSRRLGKSLGVNNVFKKYCTYDCLYCQIGRTDHLIAERRRFYGTRAVVKEVSERARDASFDYITFVPDGEPTLDLDLGEEVRELKELGKLALITNGSLFWRDDVKGDSLAFDWVSVKIDAADELTWKKINRPGKSLEFRRVIEGILEFSKAFKGILVSETMLVRGVNDSRESLERIADLLSEISPKVAYISIPIRPPAYRIEAPSEEKVDEAYVVFSARGLKVELLSRPEAGEFDLGDDPKEGILSIVAVHPMRLEVVERELKKRGFDLRVLDELVGEEKVEILEYRGEKFLRKR